MKYPPQEKAQRRHDQQSDRGRGTIDCPVRQLRPTTQLRDQLDDFDHPAECGETQEYCRQWKAGIGPCRQDRKHHEGHYVLLLVTRVRRQAEGQGQAGHHERKQDSEPEKQNRDLPHHFRSSVLFRGEHTTCALLHRSNRVR